MDPTGSKPAGISREPILLARDRRECVRHKVHTPAYASLNGPSSGMVLDLSEISDINEQGMSIQTSSPLEVDSSLNLCLDLSETKAYIHTTGHVIWSDHSGRAGIRFPEMPASSLSQLREWLFLNAITACDRAVAQIPRTDGLTGISNGHLEQAGMLREEDETETPALADYTTILAALAAVKREVEAIGPDLDASLRLVAERALSFTRATGAAIALSQGAGMICRASAGPDAPPLGTRLTVGSGFSGECVRTGMLLRCDDSETDPRVDRESCLALGIRSMIAVPIRFGDVVIGLLEVFSPKPNGFSSNDNAVLQRLAQIALVAVNRATQIPPAKVNWANVSPAKGPDQLAAHAPVEADADTFPPLGSDRIGSRQILLLAVAATLAIVSVWLAAPWRGSGLSTAMGSPRRTSSLLTNSKPPVPASKPFELAIAGGSDLVGLRKLAEQGEPRAQFALGARYATGEDVAQSYPEAMRWFSMAAEQGHIVAQATLGAYYWAGRGVPEDLSRAYFWSILAQAGGDQGSKYRVAALTSRMTRAQVLAAQKQANEWLTHHQLSSQTPSDSQ